METKPPNYLDLKVRDELRRSVQQYYFMQQAIRDIGDLGSKFDLKPDDVKKLKDSVKEIALRSGNLLVMLNGMKQKLGKFQSEMGSFLKKET